MLLHAALSHWEVCFCMNKVIQKAKLQSSRILLKLYNKKKVMLFLIRAPSIFFLPLILAKGVLGFFSLLVAI